MKKSKYIILLLVSAYLISSCNESSTDPNTTAEKASDYMPLTEGNWWEYVNYELDKNGMKKEETKYISTMRIGEKSIVDGKTAFEVLNEREDSDGDTNSNYMSSDDNYIYMYVSDFSKKYNPDSLEKRWMKFLSTSEENWEAYSYEVDEPYRINEEYDGDLVGIVKETGYNLGDTTVNIKGESYKALNVQFIFRADLEVIAWEQVYTRFTIRDTTYFTFAKGVGICRNTSLSAEPKDGKYGKYQILTDFEIKN